MALAPYAGLKIALLTGRSSKITQHRGEELKVAFCRQGVQNKVAELSQIIEEEGWSWEEIGYMGDDLNDLGSPVATAVTAPRANGLKWF